MDNEKYIPEAMITGQSYYSKNDRVLEPFPHVETLSVEAFNDLIDDHNELLRQLQNNRYVNVKA